MSTARNLILHRQRSRKTMSRVLPTAATDESQNWNDIESLDMEYMDPLMMAERNQAAQVLQKRWRKRMSEQNKYLSAPGSSSASQGNHDPKNIPTWHAGLIHEIQESAKIQRIVRDILIYTIFLFFFSQSTNGQLNDPAFYQFSAALRNQVIEMPTTSSGKTFSTLSNIQDFYDWFEGPFVGAVYPNYVQVGNRTSNHKSEDGMIQGYNYVLGGIRVGQLRSKKVDCSARALSTLRDPSSMLESFRNISVFCYGSNFQTFDVEREEDQRSFGSVQSNNNSDDNVTPQLLFVFRGWNDSDTEADRELVFSDHRSTVTGHRFPSPAFNVVLPRADGLRARELIHALISRQYVDHHTRVIFIDVNVYNPILNYIHVLRMVFEVPAGGGVFTSHSHVTVPFSTSYFINVDSLYLSITNALVLVFYLYFIVVEIHAIKTLGWRYFASVATWIQDINLFLFICYWVAKMTAFLHFPETFPLKEDTFVSYRPYSEAFMFSQYIYACTAFLSWFKWIKYMEIVPHFALVTDTLSNAAAGLSGFMVLFFIITYAYASAYLMTFGTKLEQYSTTSKTYYALLKSLLGDFDLDALVREHYVMGPLLFVLFVSVAVFVILNLLIAIISESYEQAQNDMATKEDVELLSEIRHFGKVKWIKWTHTLSRLLGWDKLRTKRRAKILESLTAKPFQAVEKGARRISSAVASSALVFPNPRPKIKPLGKSVHSSSKSVGSSEVSEHVLLLQGMMMQLAHQNEHLQQRLDEVLRDVSEISEELKLRARASSVANSSSQNSTNVPSRTKSELSDLEDLSSQHSS